MKLNMNMKNNLNKKIYRYKYNYKYMSIHLNSVCANSELKYIISSKLNIKYIKTKYKLFPIFYIYYFQIFLSVYKKDTEKSGNTYIK